MTVGSTSLDNVIVDLYVTLFDATVGAQVLSAVPIATSIAGHLQDISNLQESRVEGVQSMDKSVHYRFVVARDSALFSSLQTGQFIRVTSVRHPITKAWVTNGAGQQYIVRYINEIHSASPFVSLCLTRKDQA